MSSRNKRGLHFYQKEKRINKNVIKTIITYLFLVLVSAFVALVTVYTVGLSTTVIGNSMEPTLHGGQKILINRVVYSFSKPQRGDVIVFLPNGNPKAHYYVKRVIGLPGEKVQITQGKIYIDDELLTDISFDKVMDGGIASEGLYLGENEFFVLGDNVNSSEDSRNANVGPVQLSNILGKAWFKFKNEDEHSFLIR